jgi:hypothetical protein
LRTARTLLTAGAIAAAALGLAGSAGAATTAAPAVVHPQNVSSEHCYSHWYSGVLHTQHSDFCATVYTAPGDGLDVMYIRVTFDFQEAWAGYARAQPLTPDADGAYQIQEAWNSPHINQRGNSPLEDSIGFGKYDQGVEYKAGTVLDVYPMADPGFKQPLGQTVFTLTK